MISCDMALAVNPGYADKLDPNHMPKINEGPVIKHSASKRYSTECETAAMFLLLAEEVGAPTQWFVCRSDERSGSTVGPMLASRLAIRSVDVGNPMLSMHSIREMCGTKDHPWLVDILTEFFKARLPAPPL